MNTKQILLTFIAGFVVASVLIGGFFFIQFANNSTKQTQKESTEFFNTDYSENNLSNIQRNVAQPSIQTLPFARGFKMQVPTKWTYAPSELEGGAAKTTDVFDENNKLVMRVVDANIPREFFEAKMIKGFINTALGKINKFTVSFNYPKDVNKVSGMILYNYGIDENGFEISVYYGSDPLARNAGEYEKGEGIPLRYKTLQDVQDDPLIEQIIQSISQ